MYLLQLASHLLCRPVVAGVHDLVVIHVERNTALGMLISRDPCIGWLLGFRFLPIRPCTFPNQQHLHFELLRLVVVVRELRNRELARAHHLCSVLQACFSELGL